jgi:hypothetical protein
MRVAGCAEGDVGHGEDDAAMGKALEVDHVGLEGEPEATVAPANLEIFDPEGSRPRIVLDPGCELSRYRLFFKRPGHWMVAVRMKFDSLDDCCSR